MRVEYYHGNSECVLTAAAQDPALSNDDRGFHPSVIMTRYFA
jgi:hypothetical protein